MHPLKDKVVLITGGSSGIGRGTALRLAGHGAHLALAARTPAALEQTAADVAALGAQALAVPTDVTDREQCRRAVAATVERFGRLDVLLCSAGISMRAAFDGSDLDAMERVIRVNFLGTLYATYFALPHVKRARGSLVAVSSLTGKRGTPSYAVYGASKFGVQGLYESLRVELASEGVHVGIFSPGFVDTPLRENVLGPDGRIWDKPPQPPFRVWPVEKCVDRIVGLLVKRKGQSLLPGFIGPMLALDDLSNGRLGDWLLGRHFHPEDLAPPEAPRRHEG